MKKLLIILLFPFAAYSQDSTVISIGAQVRDWEYATQFMYNSTALENVFDSVKIKFRIQNPPTGNTVVSVSGYTVDFFNLFQIIKNDATAIKAGCTSRIEVLLRALNQPYLTGKLDAIDLADTQTFQTMRQFGRDKLRRRTN